MMHLLLACLLFCTPAADPDLLSAVPAGARVVVNVRSVEEIREAMETNSFGRFFSDPVTAALFAPFFEDLKEKARSEGAEDLASGKLFETVSGPVAFFFTLHGAGSFGFALLVAPGGDREKFDDYFTSFRHFLRDREDISDSLELYGGEEFLVLESLKKSAEGGGTVLCDMGEEVFLCGDTSLDRAKETAEGIVDRLKGEGGGESILDSERFADAREAGGGPGMVEIYADAGGLIAEAVARSLEGGKDEEGGPEKKVLEALGLDEISGFYATGRIGEGEEMELAFFLGLEGEGAARGFAECLDGPVPRGMFELMPADSAGASACFLDLDSLYGKILDVVRAVGEEDYKQYRGFYDATVKKKLGIDPEKEILALLDGRWGGFSTALPEGEASRALPGLPAGKKDMGALYLVGLKDAGAFKGNFEKMLRAFGLYPSIKKEDFQGHTLFSSVLPGAPFRLYWVFGGDLAAFSLFPTPIRSFLRLLSHEDQPSVLDNERYAPLIGMSRGRGGVSVADTARSFKGAIEAFGSIADGAGGLSGVLGLPPVSGGEEKDPLLSLRDVVDKYFHGAAGSFLFVDDKGIHGRIVCR